MKKAISMDQRERIVEAYDGKEGSREEVARRFKVSVELVKKLLRQRKRTGDLRPRYRYCGRRAKVLPEHGQALKQLIAKEPDLTLAEMKERLGLGCTVAANHWVLNKLGLTYKKRRSMRLNKTGRTSSGRAAGGSEARAGSARPDLSLSTSRRPRRTGRACAVVRPRGNGWSAMPRTDTGAPPR
jgi:transposase